MFPWILPYTLSFHSSNCRFTLLRWLRSARASCLPTSSTSASPSASSPRCAWCFSSRLSATVASLAHLSFGLGLQARRLLAVALIPALARLLRVHQLLLLLHARALLQRRGQPRARVPVVRHGRLARRALLGRVRRVAGVSKRLSLYTRTRAGRESTVSARVDGRESAAIALCVCVPSAFGAPAPRARRFRSGTC